MKVIVIGGGPAGYEAALGLGRRGVETVLIEKTAMGGTCVNCGCIPTRVYLQAIKSADNLYRSGFGQTKLPPQALRRSAAAKIEQLAYGMTYMLQKRKVQMIEGTVSRVETGKVTLEDGTSLTCDKIVIASGSEAARAETFTAKQYFTAEQLLTLENLPEQLDIIGGGVLGVELAVILQYLGVQITLHESMSRILPKWDRDVSAAMTAYLKGLGIQIETEVKSGAFENMVFCCGRKPRLPEIKGTLHKIHLIGDCKGAPFTADIAAEDGRRIASLLTGGGAENEVNGTAAPSAVTAQCIFTPLEAAAAGSLCKEGMVESSLSTDMMAGGVLFGTQGAFVKAVMEQETHILKGFHVVSHLASEVIQIGQMAIAAEMTAEQFMTTVFPHPTEGELLKEAVRGLLCD